MVYATYTREEIELLFGEIHSEDVGDNDIRGRLKERIILNPVTAKHLAALLHRGVLDYESKFGRMETESSPPARRNRKPSPVDSSSFNLDSLPESAGLLYQLTKRLDTDIGFERSFKMSAQRLLANRFLLGIKKDSIKENPHDKILGVCRQTDMPENFLAAFKEHLDQADFVHFGFEENEKTCVYKAYLEFYEKIEQKMITRPHPYERHLMHLGFKWDAVEGYSEAASKTASTIHSHPSQ